MKNYYEILEVDVKASSEIIDKAFKVLAKKYHPDAHNSDKKEWAEEKFKEINEAYEILSNEEKRKEYDIELDYDKNSAIEAICTKNEYLENLVKELQSELNRIKNNTAKSNFTNIYSNYTNNSTANTYTNNASSNYKYNNYYTTPNNKTYYSNKPRLLSFNLKDLIALIITFFLLIIIGIIVWNIPFTHTLLVNLYENNKPIKAIVNAIIEIFNK